MAELASKYSKLEMEYLCSLPKTELTPAEFLAVFKHEQKLRGYEEGGRRRLNDDDDLYEVFEILYAELGEKINGNRLVKAIRAADLKCSNERSKVLVETFKERYKEES